jgi:hypothetical protein
MSGITEHVEQGGLPLDVIRTTSKICIQNAPRSTVSILPECRQAVAGIAQNLPGLVAGMIGAAISQHDAGILQRTIIAGDIVCDPPPAPDRILCGMIGVAVILLAFGLARPDIDAGSNAKSVESRLALAPAARQRASAAHISSAPVFLTGVFERFHARPKASSSMVMRRDDRVPTSVKNPRACIQRWSVGPAVSSGTRLTSFFSGDAVLSALPRCQIN